MNNRRIDDYIFLMLIEDLCGDSKGDVITGRSGFSER